MLSIHETSRLTGIPSSTLRFWEGNYGWPKPERGPNGYRLYRTWMINDLIRVRDLTATGVPITEIIKDGAVYFPTVQVTKPAKVLFDFSAVPMPRDRIARQVRWRLEDAIISGNEGVIALCVATLPILHPNDRGPAIQEVLTAAGRSVTS